MTHDPLCPYVVDTDGVDYSWNDCECDLIAKVRAEESNRVMTMRYTQVKGWQEMKEAIAYQQGMEDMLAKAEQAVAKIWENHPNSDWDEFMKEIQMAFDTIRLLNGKP